ncbi:unnamed protein product, partial [Prunus brigantina]
MLPIFVYGGTSTGKTSMRCESPSDFVNFLCEALVSILGNLEGNSGKLSSKMSRKANGNMIYLIFDNLECVRGWEKGSTILPLLFNLYDILKMHEVALIFINNASLNTYYSSVGYVEPIPIYLPSYTQDDL